MNILLVDDEQDVRKSLSNFLKKLGHAVTCAANGNEGLREFHADTFDLVITDIRMPGMDGLEFLHRIKKIERSAVNVIIVTGHGDMDNAVKALRYGAYEYLQKPINIKELAIILERSAEYAALRKNYARLKEEFNQRVASETKVFRGRAEQLREAYLKEVGLDSLGVYSQPMHEVITLAEKYSLDSSIPVLVQGETGTGKELIARFIHYFGSASSLSPFVAINCAAMTQELFEGELFGHEPGAYTGATATGRKGKLEAANGGTLFLDEIGEMPVKLQAKLLRALEDKKFYRLGGVTEIPIDFRVVSATNKDLKQEVTAGRFRMDLFFRINMGFIQIPPLRERREDIIALATRFIGKASLRRGRNVPGFTQAAEDFLLSCSWPGNVRQLKNAMERLVVVGTVGKIDVRDLSFIRQTTLTGEVDADGKPILGRDDYELPADSLDIDALNMDIIRRSLVKHGGNQTSTAQYLCISRRVLQGKLKKYSLS